MQLEAVPQPLTEPSNTSWHRFSVFLRVQYLLNFRHKKHRLYQLNSHIRTSETRTFPYRQGWAYRWVELCIRISIQRAALQQIRLQVPNTESVTVPHTVHTDSQATADDVERHLKPYFWGQNCTLLHITMSQNKQKPSFSFRRQQLTSYIEFLFLLHTEWWADSPAHIVTYKCSDTWHVSMASVAKTQSVTTITSTKIPMCSKSRPTALLQFNTWSPSKPQVPHDWKDFCQWQL